MSKLMGGKVVIHKEEVRLGYTKKENTLDTIAEKLQEALLVMTDSEHFSDNCEKLNIAVKNEQTRINAKILPGTNLHSFCQQTRSILNLIKLARASEYRKSGRTPNTHIYLAIVHIAKYWQEEFKEPYASGFENSDHDQPTNEAGLFTYLCFLYVSKDRLDKEIKSSFMRQTRAVSKITKDSDAFNALLQFRV